MKITTRSGRTIDTPNIRLKSDRIAKKDSKAADLWLYEQAKIECAGNDYHTIILNSTNPARLSDSDKDTLFDLLLPDEASRYIFELTQFEENKK